MNKMPNFHLGGALKCRNLRAFSRVILKFVKLCWCKKFDKYHVWSTPPNHTATVNDEDIEKVKMS